MRSLLNNFFVVDSDSDSDSLELDKPLSAKLGSWGNSTASSKPAAEDKPAKKTLGKKPAAPKPKKGKMILIFIFDLSVCGLFLTWVCMVHARNMNETFVS